MVSDKNNLVKSDGRAKSSNNIDSERNAIDTKKGETENNDSDSDGIITGIDNSNTKNLIASQKTEPKQSVKTGRVGKNHKKADGKIVFAEGEAYKIPHQEDYTTKQKTSTSIINSNPDDLANDSISPVDTVKSIPENNVPLINDVALKIHATDSIIPDKIDGTKKAGNKEVTILQQISKEDTSSANKVQVKQKGGWEMGFNFSLGAATTQNGFFGIVGSGGGPTAYAAADQATGGVTSQPGNSIYIPSTIKPGVGVVVGVFVKKNISHGTKILVGLNYKIYNSTMTTGPRMDSGSLGNASSGYSSYFRIGSGNSYKNSFHFLELPAAFQFTLSKQNKPAIYLNTGVSVSQLVGSTALQFDAATGRYYRDNSVFNKTQFNLSTGLLFSISGQAKHPLLIGPDISYSVTKVASSGLFNNKHFSYIGLSIQKAIGKK